VVGLHWTHYGDSYGHATGVVLFPSVNAPARRGTINVHRPRHHGHRIFFIRMRWTFHRSDGTVQTVYWHFAPNFPGGTCATWET
jgi:hypothetical protein